LLTNLVPEKGAAAAAGLAPILTITAKAAGRTPNIELLKRAGNSAKDIGRLLDKSAPEWGAAATRNLANYRKALEQLSVGMRNSIHQIEALSKGHGKVMDELGNELPLHVGIANAQNNVNEIASLFAQNADKAMKYANQAGLKFEVPAITKKAEPYVNQARYFLHQAQSMPKPKP